MIVSEEIRTKICDLYLAGNSIKEVRKIVGVSEPTISKILKSNNIQIRKTNYQKINLDDNLLNDLYNSGSSTYELAKRFGVSDETIRKKIKHTRTRSEQTYSIETKMKIGLKSKANWLNSEYKAKVAAGKTEEYYINLSTKAKENYSQTLGDWIQTPESRIQISEIAKLLWKDPEYRAKQEIYFQERGQRLSDASAKALADPEKRKKWINNLRKANADNCNTGWVSSTQKQLYYILEDSKVEFFEEGQNTKISPFYVVDCVVPVQQQMKKPLIIEVNGEYWHSLPHVALKDRQKKTYIKNNTNYDLLTLEELQFCNYQEIKAQIAKFGLKLSETTATVNDLIIRKISESEAKMLYSIFHYSSTIRKGATTFGAFVDDNLVAAISYTYPLRRSSAIRLNLELKEVMEISRLARKTNFSCKNFSSWFISKTVKMLPRAVKCIISFSDQTFGHTGVTYKASNFIEDGQIAPDYSYISMNGQYHKKTIWDRAKRMKMSENDYAQKHGLKKIVGGPKTRWILHK